MIRALIIIVFSDVVNTKKREIIKKIKSNSQRPESGSLNSRKIIQEYKTVVGPTDHGCGYPKDPDAGDFFNNVQIFNKADDLHGSLMGDVRAECALPLHFLHERPPLDLK